MRGVLRVVIGAVLCGVLLGAPLVLGLVVAERWPSSEQWRRVWRTGRVEGEMLVAVGAVLFALLWVWFVATVVSEVVSAVRIRRSTAVPTVAPGGWLRRLVRFVAVSAAVAAVSNGPTSVAGRVPTARASAVAVDTPDVVETDAGVQSVMPFLAGFGSAFALAVGVLAMVGERRRSALRSSVVGDRAVAPSLAQVRAEMQLRSMARPVVIDRLDLAIRAVARHVAAMGSSIVAVIPSSDGVTVVLGGSPGAAPAPWVEVALPAGRETLTAWRLGDNVPDDYLAAMAGSSVSPCPALVHLGAAYGGLGGEVFVDVEAVGALWLATPHAAAIGRHLALQMSTTRRSGPGRVLTVGVDCSPNDGADVVATASVEAAIAAAVRSTVSTAAEVDANDSSTFALRTLGTGERWEPDVVVSAVPPTSPVVLRAGRGVGLVAPVGDGRWDAPGWYVRATSTGDVLEPLGFRVSPVGLSVDDVGAVEDLVHAAELPFEHVAPVVPIVAPTREVEPYVEPSWRVMVRVLGPVQVTSCDGQVAGFQRRKALELLVWLSQHRARPTRSAARTALWEVDVSDASFLNVLSDLRRRLSECAGELDAGDWVGRSSGDVLPLHESVITDDDIVAGRLAASKGLPPDEAIAVLQPAVELIVGTPFGGTDYLWVDAEGVMSAMVVRAITAASELARHQLAVGDIEGVFWSTGQGLKVLPGHEELVALRMRAHARAGDMAGVRHEWSRYLVALAADPWSAADPSPKLLALRAELLSARPEAGAIGG